MATKRRLLIGKQLSCFSGGYIIKVEEQNHRINPLDSGFFQTNILDHLEQKVMDYIVAVKFTHPIQRVIQQSNNWIVLDTELKFVNKCTKVILGINHVESLSLGKR